MTKKQKTKELNKLRKLASEIVHPKWQVMNTVETHGRGKNCASDCSPQCSPACSPTDPNCTPRTGCNPIK